MTHCNPMFCYQCEQTAGGTACVGKAGVCGKAADTSDLQDELTGAMIAVACQIQEGAPVTQDIYDAIVAGLFTTVTNVAFDDEPIRARLEAMRAIGAALAVDGPAYREFPMADLWEAPEDFRSLKSLILFGLRGMAAYAYHARMLEYVDTTVDEAFIRGLAAIALVDDAEELLGEVLKVGEANLACMALLDAANTETYGTPEPTEVTMTVEKGPFIIISGHDLHDLYLLLQQTEGTGVNVYTNGEMLPAHAYPKLKAFPHLKGNFGTAWQNQQKELDAVPAPVLFTTNCLMPPKESYADRVYTTEVVSYPGMMSIGPDKDFTPLIEKALELGGYDEDRTFTGINGGSTLTTGFGHGTVLSVAPAVVEAVKNGDISHFYLVAGCDGRRPSRQYYTDFVKLTQPDEVVLTLACGKFRFNDLDLGTVAGLPRLMDMGQCNDAYSAIRVAVALAEAFECEVNELPLSFVLSWYEQKAVCILLTLLYLGIQDMRLGPTLPAFVSPAILDVLVEKFGIAPTTTAEADYAALSA